MARRKWLTLTSCCVLALLAADKPAAEPAFHKELKQIAADYLPWGRVDDEMRWAPYLCRAPRSAVALESASKDEATHGRKLYSLFAKELTDYHEVSKTKSAKVGQVIVKQSWVPEEITGETADLVKKHAAYPTADISTVAREVRRVDPKNPLQRVEDHFFPYVVKNGKVYKASKQADLFIMMKLDPKTPDTDDGWVYGTVTPDGKKVTSAGRVASCMKCHVDAKTDRLFGLAK